MYSGSQHMAIDRIAFAHSTFNRACLVGLLAWQASSAALAAESPLIASGSASITGFQYELVNLATTPGSPAPWIKFPSDLESSSYGVMFVAGDNGPVSEEAINVGGYQQWGGVMPTTALIGFSDNGLAQGQVSPTSMSAAASLPANVDYGAGPYSPGGVVLGASLYGGTADPRSRAPSLSGPNGEVMAYAGEPSPYFDFTLSAHTALVLRGHASADMSFNPEVSPWPIDMENGPTSHGPLVQVGASMSLSFSDPMKPLAESYPDQQTFEQALNDAYGYVSDGVAFDWTLDGTGTHGPTSKDIVLTLTNDSDKEATGAMYLQTRVMFVMAADPKAPVPEPGAPLMVGLGLAVVLAWRRRVPASA